MKNFIVFEGIDGSGKGTQIEMLKEYLKENGQDAFFTREPGGNKISEQIRGVIKGKENIGMTDICELLLFEASRNQFINDSILPNKGKIIVSDRYCYSTIAYQGYGRGIDLEIINSANKIATQGIEPECVIYLDVPANIGELRNSVHAEKEDRIEIAGRSFMEKVRLGYLECATNDPERWVVLDGTRSKEEIFEEIVSVLKERGIIKENVDACERY